jgi:ParB family chromosome partitioning protein
MAPKKGLGRGLNDLLGTSEATKPNKSKNTISNKTSSDSSEAKIVEKEVIKEVVKEVVKEVEQKVKITDVEPNRSQPRKQFDEEALQELADSIKQFGVLEPLIVTKKGDYYEIIAGERRWRAARIAGLKEIPVVIRDYTDKEIMEISLIENIQREDLNPIEEAQAYEALISEYNLKQEEVAERVSKSRSTITNSLRLLKLCEDVRQMVMYNMISTGHARALIPIEDPKLQYETAAIVYDQHMSVRETEAYVKSVLENKPEPEKEETPQNNMNVFYSDIENKLKSILGAKIAIKSSSNNKKGKIEISYSSPDELDRITEMLYTINKDI